MQARATAATTLWFVFRPLACLLHPLLGVRCQIMSDHVRSYQIMSDHVRDHVRYRGTTTACMRVLAEPVFPSPFHPVCLFSSSLHLLMFPFLPGTFFFLLGTLGDYYWYGGDGVGMNTAIEDTAVRRGQTRQQCPRPSGSCIPNPVRVLPQRRLGDVICFVAVFLLALLFRFVWVFGTGARITALAPLNCRWKQQCAGDRPCRNATTLQAVGVIRKPT